MKGQKRIPINPNINEEAANQFGEILKGKYEDLTLLERAIIQERYLNPRILNRQIAEKFHCSTEAIVYHVNKPRVKAAELQIQQNFWFKVEAARMKAMENAFDWLISDDAMQKKEKLEMTKIFVMKLADSEAGMPATTAEGPKFIRGKGD